MVRLLPFLYAVACFAQPRLLFNPDDRDRVRNLSASETWAQRVVDEVVRVADGYPRDYLAKYGLSEPELPEEGGQWSHWYVCPVHGVSLRFTAPKTHTCPVDSRVYEGWPYDQVIYERRHYDLAYVARDSGLAYQLTGKRAYAEQTAAILLAYADRYLSYPIKDRDNRVNARTGGRMGAQTLDEAIWLIPIAWAYDLISDSDVLNSEQRAHIEKDLLRAAVEVIQRNDAGISNWQSWHNAGIGAVAFTLRDQRLIDEVVDGKSGFRFQMRNSVEAEGFWYEGAWSYHFYALDALAQTAEMAARSGIDLWAEPGLRNMFSAPLKLLFANGTLPAFNDSGAVNIASSARLYEIAFARLGDPLLGAVAGRQGRSRNSLFWGAEELSGSSLSDLSSEIFPQSGFAALRAAGSDHTVMMKFGPHGGGHGHYDKLGLTSFFNGGVLAVDPGTQSYAAPTHNTWDKMTVAHNTVVVDERTQGEATGKLLWHSFTEAYSAVRAEAGPAYRNAQLARTLFHTGEYTLDLFDVRTTDGQPHQIDYVYHNNGAIRTDLAMAPYSSFPRANGYQHLSRNTGAAPAGDWQVEFAERSGGASYGSAFRSNENVRGGVEYSTEQASSGRFSGKMSYQFAGAGYLLVSTPTIGGIPDRTPIGLSMMVYGDGSRHNLAVRFNDSSDERFVATVGVVNWTGWRQVRVTDPSKWQHYLGNNNGFVDTPIRTVSLEFTRREEGPQTGALYVDDIRVLFEEGDEFLVTDFELATRGLRLTMLGAPETTVVTGEGLGPDLLRPVPYVMARRRGTSTRFAGLLEPFRDVPAIRVFRQTGENAYRIEGEGFVDVVEFGAEGVVRYERQR